MPYAVLVAADELAATVALFEEKATTGNSERMFEAHDRYIDARMRTGDN